MGGKHAKRLFSPLIDNQSDAPTTKLCTIPKPILKWESAHQESNAAYQRDKIHPNKLTKNTTEWISFAYGTWTFRLIARILLCNTLFQICVPFTFPLFFLLTTYSPLSIQVGRAVNYVNWLPKLKTLHTFIRSCADFLEKSICSLNIPLNAWKDVKFVTQTIACDHNRKILNTFRPFIPAFLTLLTNIHWHIAAIDSKGWSIISSQWQWKLQSIL